MYSSQMFNGKIYIVSCLEQYLPIAFFWLEDAPSVESLDLDDPESIKAFIEFWNPLVSAWNPAQNEPKAPAHPSARDPLEMN